MNKVYLHKSSPSLPNSNSHQNEEREKSKINKKSQSEKAKSIPLVLGTSQGISMTL